jgi:signal transduction histidine kinase
VNIEVTVGELDCDARVRSLIHRVAQELVRNAAKHSRARRVTLSVERNTGGILLRVADDGRGFDSGGLEQHHRQGHMGLRLLEQRVRNAGDHVEPRARYDGGDDGAHPGPPLRDSETQLTALQRVRFEAGPLAWLSVRPLEW